MSKILRNDSGSTVVVADTGVSIPDGTDYTIPPQDYLLWAASSNVVTYVGNGTLIVNDGSFDLSISDGIDLIKGIFPSDQVQDPTIANEVATLADTEYSFILPAGCRSFGLCARNASKIQLAFVSGQSNTNYVTIYPGQAYQRSNLKPATPLTLYYRVSKPSETLEILYWT